MISLRLPAALAAALVFLYRLHVTVAMGPASLTMTGLAWFFSGVAVAVAVLLVVVVRKVVTDSAWIVPRGRIT
jgi:hypothetical protein